MRWSRNKPRPRNGDTRVLCRFLWFPVKINNEWRWLEKVHIEQKYRGFAPSYDESGNLQNDFGSWTNKQWVSPPRIIRWRPDGQECKCPRSANYPRGGVYPPKPSPSPAPPKP